MTHLNSATEPIAQLPGKDRIAHIKNARWIGYTRAKEALDKMEDLLDHPRTHRMPNLLLVGETNNGKTMLLRKLQHAHQARVTEDTDGVKAPILLIQAPPVPSERLLYNSILEKAACAYRENDRIEKKTIQVLQILRSLELKVLIIDEIHHILAGTMMKQRAFLNVIKYLGNELQISIIGAGTREAFNAIHTDPQLANRFEPIVLPRWQMNEEYFRLLISFERILPLQKPSDLIQPQLAQKILAMSEGTIGEISSLLNTASIAAIKSGQECISNKLLDQMRWLSPSIRKRQIDHLV